MYFDASALVKLVVYEAESDALDAIHLATAPSLGIPELPVVSYDDRLVEAARSEGLTVKQPGR